MGFNQLAQWNTEQIILFGKGISALIHLNDMSISGMGFEKTNTLSRISRSLAWKNLLDSLESLKNLRFNFSKLHALSLKSISQLIPAKKLSYLVLSYNELSKWSHDNLLQLNHILFVEKKLLSICSGDNHFSPKQHITFHAYQELPKLRALLWCMYLRYLNQMTKTLFISFAGLPEELGLCVIDFLFPKEIHPLVHHSYLHAMRAMKEKFAEQQLLLTDCRKRKRGKAVIKTNKKRRIRKSEVAGLGPIIEHESSTHRYPLRRRRRAHKKPSGRHTFFDSLHCSTDVNMCPGFSTKMDFI